MADERQQTTTAEATAPEEPTPEEPGDVGARRAAPSPAEEPTEQEGAADATADTAEAPEGESGDEGGEDLSAEETSEDDEQPAGAESAPAAEEEASQEQASQEQAAAEEEPSGNGQAGREHQATIEELLKAGSHFGHLTSRWHPRMEKYIFMDRNNIHIIDLMQTQVLLDQAAEAARRFARRGKEILFVGTKKQAQEIVRRHAEESEQPFMVNRWLGGTMTNFQTIRRSIRRMENIERMDKDGTLDKLKKKERLMRLREHGKLEDVLGGIRNMPHLPGALFVVDVRRENIAVSEANKLGIPIIAMVDTNCDPNLVDHPIPSNDDALSSIELVTAVIARAIQDGTGARQAEEKAKQQG